MAVHLLRDQIRGAAFVELAAAVSGNARQRLREFGLTERRAALEARKIGVEIGLAGKILRRRVASLLQPRIDLKAVGRITDRGREHLLPLQLAEALLRLPHAVHGAGHRHRAMTDDAHARHQVALVVAVHVAGRLLWRALAVVEKVRLAVHEQRHEAAPADIARIRPRHGQGEGNGHGGIHRVAAGGENLLRRVGAITIGHGNRRRIEHGFGRRRFCQRRDGRNEAGGAREEQRRSHHESDGDNRSERRARRVVHGDGHPRNSGEARTP